jgi:hypothetical protein
MTGAALPLANNSLGGVKRVTWGAANAKSIPKKDTQQSCEAMIFEKLMLNILKFQ